MSSILSCDLSVNIHSFAITILNSYTKCMSSKNNQTCIYVRVLYFVWVFVAWLWMVWYDFEMVIWHVTHNRHLWRSSMEVHSDDNRCNVHTDIAQISTAIVANKQRIAVQFYAVLARCTNAKNIKIFSEKTRGYLKNHWTNTSLVCTHLNA